MMTTWANCWNGVNHRATAPTAEDDAVLLRGYQLRGRAIPVTWPRWLKLDIGGVRAARIGPTDPPSDFDGVEFALAIEQPEISKRFIYTCDPIFRSPPPQFQPHGGWDLAR